MSSGARVRVLYKLLSIEDPADSFQTTNNGPMQQYRRPSENNQLIVPLNQFGQVRDLKNCVAVQTGVPPERQRYHGISSRRRSRGGGEEIYEFDPNEILGDDNEYVERTMKDLVRWGDVELESTLGVVFLPPPPQGNDDDDDDDRPRIVREVDAVDAVAQRIAAGRATAIEIGDDGDSSASPGPEGGSNNAGNDDAGRPPEPERGAAANNGSTDAGQPPRRKRRRRAAARRDASELIDAPAVADHSGAAATEEAGESGDEDDDDSEDEASWDRSFFASASGILGSSRRDRRRVQSAREGGNADISGNDRDVPRRAGATGDNGSAEAAPVEDGRGHDGQDEVDGNHVEQADERREGLRFAGGTVDAETEGRVDRARSAAPAAARDDAASSQLRRWLQGLDANGSDTGRFARYAPAFEREFDTLQDVALAAASADIVAPDGGMADIFRACGIATVGDRARIRWAIGKLPRPTA